MFFSTPGDGGAEPKSVTSDVTSVRSEVRSEVRSGLKSELGSDSAPLGFWNPGLALGRHRGGALRGAKLS